MDFSQNPAGIPQLAFTHAGRFHADDVFSAALLRILRPDIRIYRGFTVPKGFSGIVFDIGDGPFDHHKKDSPRRPGGTPYAAFGLLWQEYGKYFLPERAAKSFDTKFIQPLDMDDNKGTGNTLAGLIGAYNPNWDEEEDEDAAFFEAVEVAQSLLAHKLESLAAMERGHEVVRAALAKMQDGVVVLDKYVPWKPVLVESDAEFVVFPSKRSGYSLQCVPRDFSAKALHKVPMPQAWYAAEATALQQMTGVNDVTFCHASGFMCGVGSVAGALELARIAQAEYRRRQAERARLREEKAAAEAGGQTTKAPDGVDDGAPGGAVAGGGGTAPGMDEAQDGVQTGLQGDTGVGAAMPQWPAAGANGKEAETAMPQQPAGDAADDIAPDADDDAGGYDDAAPALPGNDR